MDNNVHITAPCYCVRSEKATRIFVVYALLVTMTPLAVASTAPQWHRPLNGRVRACPNTLTPDRTRVMGQLELPRESSLMWGPAVGPCCGAVLWGRPLTKAESNQQDRISNPSHTSHPAAMRREPATDVLPYCSPYPLSVQYP